MNGQNFAQSGGALPLEAQRLGLASYASDLNPVAVTINKAMIENSSGKVIVVADHTKLNNVSSFLTCPLNRIDMIVTDWLAPVSFRQELEDHGVHVVRVEDTD